MKVQDIRSVLSETRHTAWFSVSSHRIVHRGLFPSEDITDHPPQTNDAALFERQRQLKYNTA